MSLGLVGTDGKPLEPEAPRARPMPSRKEKFDMCFMMLTLMTAEERRQFKKTLRPLVRKLDIMYPNGMKEGDIQRDIEKAAAQVVPKSEGHAEPENAEVVAPHDIPVQPESDKPSAESAPAIA